MIKTQKVVMRVGVFLKVIPRWEYGYPPICRYIPWENLE